MLSCPFVSHAPDIVHGQPATGMSASRTPRIAPGSHCSYLYHAHRPMRDKRPRFDLRLTCHHWSTGP